jgi:hypothetical protein
MSRNFVVVLVLLAVPFPLLAQDKKPLQVLFIGNSYTYQNNLPKMVEEVATGFLPDPVGETGLQAVYAAQLPGMLPAALVSALLLNAAIERSSRKTKARFDAVARGWELGTRARLLFGYRWRESFARPLAEVRQELGIDASLALPRKLRAVLERDLS